jgi:putative copper resistance protein D
MADAMVLCRFVHFCVVLMRLSQWLAAVALASGVGWLLLVTASMAGTWAAAFEPAILLRVLGRTFFGEVWGWHLLLNALLVILVLTPWRSSLPLAR